MANINVEPIVLRNASIKVGADNYEKAINSIVLTPAPVSQSFDGLGDNHHVIAGKTKWTADLGYAQDWKTTNSLSRYLFNHQGDIVTMLFQPEAGEGDTFQADVLIQPGAVGGPVDTIAQTTVTLQIQGQPIIVTTP